MWVCKNCFADEEIQREVVANATKKGKCDVCGKEERLCNFSLLSEFFHSVLELFTLDENSSKTISQVLEDDWHIFSNESCANVILSTLLSSYNYGYSLDDKVTYLPDIRERISVWEQLKKNVREQYRYFVDHDKFDEYANLSPSLTLPAGTVLYRARVTPVGQKKLTTNDMGCPPKELATAGRANPLGIPYLYLCLDEKTTYYEVRAVFLDRLSVGKFRTNRDLNIVDFNSKVSLYISFDGIKPLAETVVQKKILDSISTDLSKPLRRFDTELEYVPTQLICEYCKRNGADGVRFKSSLHKDGVNYVLFNSNDARCYRVVHREIKEIGIDIERIK